MSIGPAGVLGASGIDKSGLQRLLPAVSGASLQHTDQVRHDRSFFEFLRRFHYLQLIFFRVCPNLLSDAGNPATDQIPAVHRQGIIGIDPAVDQKRVPDGVFHIPVRFCRIYFGECPERVPQCLHLLIRPGIRQVLSRHLRQFLISARPGKNDLKEPGHFIEVHILVVGNTFRVFGPGRHQPDHICQNGNRLHIFHDRNPFVALLHVKAVLIFIRYDRVPQAFVQLRVIQIGPFHGKFGILRDQRHKIAGKGILSAGGPGPDDHIQRNLSNPHMNLFIGADIFDLRLQRRKIRLLPLQQGTGFILITNLFGILVIISHSGFSFHFPLYYPTGSGDVKYKEYPKGKGCFRKSHFLRADIPT